MNNSGLTYYYQLITQEYNKAKQHTPKQYKLHKMHTAPGFLMVIHQLVLKAGVSDLLMTIIKGDDIIVLVIKDLFHLN